METVNKKGFIITIIILLVIILVLGGYIAVEKFILNKEENSTITVINDTEIDLNSFYQIADTLNKFDSAFNDINSTYLGYPYVARKLMAEKFDLGAALYVSAYGELQPTSEAKTLPEIIVKNNFEKIFGKNLKYKAKSINAGDTYKLTYAKDKANYSYTLNSPKVPYSAGYVVKNIKTKLADEKIIVTRKVFYVEYENIDEATGVPTIATIYKNPDKNSKIGQVSVRKGILSENEVVAKYGSKLNTYDMVFKHNKDDDYSFYLIEKTK